MRLRRLLIALPAAAAALLLATSNAALADESVQVKLLPLNHSGATGTATLTAMDNGDLKVSTDFRDLYATLLADVLQTDPGAVLAGWRGRLDQVLV